jgi:Secretion system C-terminal sorting domain/Pregnancy-associated plasma protein-A
MKQLYCLWAFIALLYSFPATAQYSECGTEPGQAEIKYLLEQHQNFERFPTQKIRSRAYKLPVKIHIITKEDGTANINEKEAYREIFKVNDLFSGADIEFYVSDEIDFIKEEKYYNFNQQQEAQLAANYDEKEVINIYFFSTIQDRYENYICGYTYLPNDQYVKNRIFLSTACMNSGITLAHEMGHYLGLIHTHGSNALPKELVNGSNCPDAGDLLCDTPADPKLTGNVDKECNYTGNETDEEGNPFNPDTKNVMSYSPSYCRSYFTEKQNDKMVFTYINSRADLKIKDGYLPVEDVYSGAKLATTETKNELAVQLKSYPNPTNGWINIKVESSDPNEQVLVSIVDMTGNTIYEQYANGTGEQLNVDLSNYSKGLYFINVIGNKVLASNKIMFQ